MSAGHAAPVAVCCGTGNAMCPVSATLEGSVHWRVYRQDEHLQSSHTFSRAILPEPRYKGGERMEGKERKMMGGKVQGRERRIREGGRNESRGGRREEGLDRPNLSRMSRNATASYRNGNDEN